MAQNMIWIMWLGLGLWMSAAVVGEPLQLVKKGEGKDSKRYVLCPESLERFEQLVQEAECGEQRVVVIAASGPFRKGKSWLLNVFIKYLSYEGGDGNWLGSGDDQLDVRGFPWRGGSQPETVGVWIWDRLFTVELPSGEKVRVMLMDTQGAFDAAQSTNDCATIFALSAFVSSLQIVNLSQQIESRDLHYLQAFLEFGKMASAEVTDHKPFQDIHFLIRDWPYADEYGYGEDGGRQYLDNTFNKLGADNEEIKMVKTLLNKSFDKISCSLMPNPGPKLAESGKKVVHMKVKDLSENFCANIKSFTEGLFAAEKLLPKSINGSPVTVGNFLDIFRSYVNVFNSDEMPELQSIYTAQAESNHLVAMQEAKRMYTDSMNMTVYESVDSLKKDHDIHRQEAVAHYLNKKKLGSREYENSYLNKLTAEIQSHYQNRLTTLEHEIKLRRETAVAATVAAGSLATAAAAIGLYGYDPSLFPKFHKQVDSQLAKWVSNIADMPTQARSQPGGQGDLAPFDEILAPSDEIPEMKIIIRQGYLAVCIRYNLVICAGSDGDNEF